MYRKPVLNNMIRDILIVEDEENTRIGLKDLLTTEGYRVTSAGDGFEALECLREDSFQLVITDINMPRMNGMAFLEQLKQHYPALDVIMMTAFGGIKTYVDAMNNGVYEYLHKPVRLDALRSVMQKLSHDREEALRTSATGNREES